MKTELEPKDIELIADRVAQRLEPKLPRKEKDNVIFDLHQLCQYLSVTEKWVYEQTRSKRIPHYKLGNKQLRFRRKDIDRWLDSKRA